MTNLPKGFPNRFFGKINWHKLLMLFGDVIVRQLTHGQMGFVATNHL
jgi:hypothetical protein